MTEKRTVRAPRCHWVEVGRYVVSVERQRKRYRSPEPSDRHLFAFIVLGKHADPNTIRPTIAWGTVRRGVVTLIGGILPDAPRSYLERWS